VEPEVPAWHRLESLATADKDDAECPLWVIFSTEPANFVCLLTSDTAHFLNQPHQGVDLHGPLALEVLQHRCLVRANLARAVDAPFDIESGS
jgi:hypothetical protein